MMILLSVNSAEQTKYSLMYMKSIHSQLQCALTDIMIKKVNIMYIIQMEELQDIIAVMDIRG